MAEGESPSVAVKAASITAFVMFLAAVTVNALANILPINGVQTGVLSDELVNLFVPAGLTFSIWGLIYLLLAAYGITVLVQAFRPVTARARWDAADGWIFSLNMAANMGWILAWHHRMVGVSLALMLVILATLILLEERNAARGGSASDGSGKTFSRLLLTTPLNVYMGWICVATIANVTALLVKVGWDGFGLDPRFWAVAVIIAGLAVGLILVFLRGALAAPLVIVWAYAGIAIKRLGMDADLTAAVWGAAIVAATVLAPAAVGRWAVMAVKARRT